MVLIELLDDPSWARANPERVTVAQAILGGTVSPHYPHVLELPDFPTDDQTRALRALQLDWLELP